MSGGDPRRESTNAPDHCAELARQRELLAELFSPRAGAAEVGEDETFTARHGEPGLRAYRANAHASAERALTSACPTLRALIGAEDFTHLAREFWHAHPPQRGDLAAWGDALPVWLDAHAGLAAWPYLGDCAALDLAVHHCERAADGAFDPSTLAPLADHEPHRLRLQLLPGVQCLESRWPIATLHAAHAQDGEALFERARARMQAGEGDAVVVARDGWRGVVRQIDAPGFRFMRALLRDADLAQALTAAGDAFDFGAWLADAVRHHWLQRVEPRGD